MADRHATIKGPGHVREQDKNRLGNLWEPQLNGAHLHRPPPRRRRRGPVDVQRPHHRDRHQVLPPRRQPRQGHPPAHPGDTVMTKPSAPKTDSDTYEVLDEALSELADRRRAWLGDDIVVISLLASLIDQAERIFPELVSTARANGHSWDDLAAVLA